MVGARPYPVSPAWRVLLTDLGIDAANVLRRAGLPGDLLSREQAALSTPEYFQLWLGIAEESGDPGLPLRVGAALSTETFDAPVFGALCSPDLNTALARLAHFKRLIAAMELHVDVGDDITRLELKWLDASHPPPGVVVLVELVFFVQLARIATRCHLCPTSVFSPIKPERPDAYTDFFGVPVGTGTVPALEFAAADARRPFLTANGKMWDFFEPELKRRLADLEATATAADRVHAALIELLPSGAASAASVSRRLGLSTRTLQRRLRDEGHSFQALLNDTRHALAKHYLRNSSMSSTEIAFLLGFEEPSSFFRAFNAWTGMTPEQMRHDPPTTASKP